MPNLTIEPLREGMILWRCLHVGPIGEENLDTPPPNPQVDWPAVRTRNIPLIEKLTQTYGACAIVAREQRRDRRHASVLSHGPLLVRRVGRRLLSAAARSCRSRTIWPFANFHP